MKTLVKLLTCTLMLAALANTASAAGADVQILTPHGTAYGYTYPNGDFRIDPPSAQNVGPDSPTQGSTYGYNQGHGQTVVITPGSPSTYIYDSRGERR